MKASAATTVSRADQALRSWLVSRGESDDDLGDLDEMRAMGYQLARENPVAIGAINTQITNVIGTGLRLQSRIDRDLLKREYGVTTEQADQWEVNTEARFRAFAESTDCDIERQSNFYDLQALMVRIEMMAGDAWALQPIVPRTNQPFSLRIQMIDPARIRNKNNAANTTTLSGGVRRSGNGAVVAYDILKGHPWSSKLDAKKFEWDTVQAFGRRTGRKNMAVLMTKQGVGASRGRPAFAPLVKTLKQLGRYTDSELMRALVQSFFTVFIKTEGGTGLSHGDDPIASNVDLASNELALGMGNVIDLAQGEDIELAKSESPNAAFDGFMAAMLRQVGMALNIPYEVLVKHFQSSYSAARAAMLDYWKAVKTKRGQVSSHFCQVVYENWLAESVARGQTEAPGFFRDPFARYAWCGAAWIGPPRGMIDPTKEVKAELELLGAGIKSRADISQELLGTDWETNLHRLAREERLIASVGLVNTISGGVSDPAGSQPEPAAPADDNPDVDDDPDAEENAEDSLDETPEE